jgi:hypothetical protein
MSEELTMQNAEPRAARLEAWGAQGRLLSGTVDMRTRKLMNLDLEARPEALRELFALLSALSGHVMAEMERQHALDAEAWKGGQGA